MDAKHIATRISDMFHDDVEIEDEGDVVLISLPLLDVVNDFIEIHYDRTLGIITDDGQGLWMTCHFLKIWSDEYEKVAEHIARGFGCKWVRTEDKGWALQASVKPSNIASQCFMLAQCITVIGHVGQVLGGKE